MRMNKIVGLFVIIITLALAGCGGGRGFTRGEYDDPTRVELLDDKFSESDMQQMATTIIDAMVSCPYITNAKKAPIVIVERLANRTQEHIDTVALTDKIRTSLIKSGKVRFVNKEERSTLDDEYNYNSAGNISAETSKKRGKQVGADYILSGALSTNIQEMGSDKFVYYKLTINLTNIESSTIDCTEEKELRKKYEKKRYGL